MSHPFEIPTAPVICEQTIKKSRFITQLHYVADRDAANAMINEAKMQYPDARHHCWAFIAGAPDDTQVLGFSDDGEPNGTAGKPMLAQLQGSGLGYVCAVVIRYFGGIKLGSGGLVKAYGSSVGMALDEVQRQPFIPKQQLSFSFNFDHLGSVTQMMRRYDAEQSDIQYSDRVTLTVTLPAQHQHQFVTHLTNACSGQIEFIEPD